MSRRAWFLFASFGLVAKRHAMSRKISDRTTTCAGRAAHDVWSTAPKRGSRAGTRDADRCAAVSWRIRVLADAMLPGDVDVFVPFFPRLSNRGHRPPISGCCWKSRIRITGSGSTMPGCSTHVPSSPRVRTRRRLGAKTSRDQVSRYTICESRGVDGRATRADDGKGR